jgi:hypothetical protein
MKLMPAKRVLVLVSAEDKSRKRFLELTCELLERLYSHACKLSLENGGSEAIHIGALPHGHFEVVDGSNFCQLGNNGFVVDWQTPETAERVCSLFCVVLFDQIPGRFGEEHQAKEEDK